MSALFLVIKTISNVNVKKQKHKKTQKNIKLLANLFEKLMAAFQSFFINNKAWQIYLVVEEHSKCLSPLQLAADDASFSIKKLERASSNSREVGFKAKSGQLTTSGSSI